MWAFTLWESGSPTLQWSVVASAAIIAAATDLAWRRIPNWLTFPLLAAGLGYAAWQCGGWGLLDSFAACVVLSLPYILLFIFAKGGAGDAKMMGAIGAWLGLINGGIALGCVAAAGILLAVIFALARQRGREVVGNVAGMAQNLAIACLTKSRLGGTLSADTSIQPMLVMPYGLAICVGVVFAATGVLLCRL